MKKSLFFFTVISVLVSCNYENDTESEDLVQYVDPFIGTQRMGHTFPGATVPFGMVQLSPDTDTILSS